MSDEERKATDVLLSIESKLEALLNHHRTQELNLKILSNKFNSLIDNMPKYLVENKSNIAQPQIKIEVADVSPIPTKGKSLNLLTDSDPIGFRRTSRPETFEDKNKQSDSRESSIQKVVQNFEHANQKENIPHIPPKLNEGAISQITQRIIDKNQKSIF
jgi:hypothetical protein